jgi:uncharacterized protein
MTAQPLTDTEYDHMGGVLKRLRGESAMNLEGLDGFFAALICGPDTVAPSEYLREILGDDITDAEAFTTQEELQEFLALVMRHWNFMVDTLHSADVFLPLLLEDEQGITHANNWARGFMRGMALRKDDWIDLLDDEEHGGSLVPILALAHEHDPDPEMRPYKEAIGAEQREKLIVGMAAGVMQIYRYFAPRRRVAAGLSRESGTYRRATTKIGRNDPCPCGSGKKYKQCCGKRTMH